MEYKGKEYLGCMHRYKTSVHTCNTDNFGIDPLQNPKTAKACCLTSTDYPSTEGYTKRTYILEVEDL